MMCCEKRSSSVGVIMYFCLVSQVRKHFHLNSALIQFGETSMLDIGRGMISGCGGGEGMVPKRR